MVPRPGCSSHRLRRRRVGCDGDVDTEACLEKCCRCRSMFKRKQQGLPKKAGTGVVLSAIGSPKSSGRGGGMFGTPRGSKQSLFRICTCAAVAAWLALVCCRSPFPIMQRQRSLGLFPPLHAFPEALREHLAKGVVWKCRFLHFRWLVPPSPSTCA